MLLAQSKLDTIKQAELGRGRYKALPGNKLPRYLIEKRKQTLERNKNAPVEEQIVRRIYQIINELTYYKRTSGEELSHYKADMVKILELFITDDNYKDFIINFFEENRRHFKRALKELLTPNYINQSVRDKVESYFSWKGKSGDVMAKTKAVLQFKEFSKPVSKCRNDSYMFANHKTNLDDPQSLIIRNIAFDFDEPTNFLSILQSPIVFNVVITDRYELEKVKTKKGTLKLIKDKTNMKSIAEPCKGHAFIKLKNPVFANNQSQHAKLNCVVTRLKYYLKKFGFYDDPSGGKVVAKNVFNSKLYQSFSFSDKEWELNELNELLDALRVPTVNEIKKEEKKTYELFIKTGEMRDGTIARGLLKHSRNCKLYSLAIRSNTSTFQELLGFLVKENEKFRGTAKGPLSYSEVRRIAKSIYQNSWVWKAEVEKRIRPCVGKQNFAQFCGTLSQMQKNEPVIQVIEELLPLFQGLPIIEQARGIQPYILEYLEKELKVSYLRKLISNLKDWKKRWESYLTLKASVNFQTVKEGLDQLAKGIVNGLNHLLLSYIAYKLTFHSRYYINYDIPYILNLITTSTKTVHSLGQIVKNT